MKSYPAVPPFHGPKPVNKPVCVGHTDLCKRYSEKYRWLRNHWFQVALAAANQPVHTFTWNSGLDFFERNLTKAYKMSERRLCTYQEELRKLTRDGKPRPRYLHGGLKILLRVVGMALELKAIGAPRSWTCNPLSSKAWHVIIACDTHI